MGEGAELKVETAPDARAAAELAAERIAEFGREAIAERGVFNLAVSGGRTPWLMLAILASKELDWEKTKLFQVDERIASPGSPDRNLTHLVLTLPIEKQAALVPMPVTRRDLEVAAESYAESLPDRFDTVHLGLGPDGHTASLLPGDPVLEVDDRPIALTEGRHEGYRRMTMTYPSINAARSIVWLVTGDEKREALQKLIDGDESVPAGKVARDSAVVVADESAIAGTHPRAPLDSDQAA